MSERKATVAEGIKYLRRLKHGAEIFELADNVASEERYIKECIRLARQHKEDSEIPPEVVMIEPHIKIYRDLNTGELQVVNEVEIDILRDIIIKFSHDEESEFTTMLPVKIKIKRA